MKLSLLYSFFTFIVTISLVHTQVHNSRLAQPASTYVDSFPLFNAAEPNLTIPAVGLGLGFYGNNNQPYGTYPECGAEPHIDTSGHFCPPPPGCGLNTQKAVYTWLNKVGGRRLDCANSYRNHKSVAQGIQQSGVNRYEIFILSKVGPTFGLGFNDTINQTMDILQELQTSWIDLLLVHWPVMKDPLETYIPETSDPACNVSNPFTYNEKNCRLSTWSAMVILFNRGIARSIGVSNYNTTHLQEIIDAGMPLPSVNQVSFNPYNYRTGRADLLKFCRKNNIQLVAYSPFGVPDAHLFPVMHEGKATGMYPTLFQDPLIISLARTYERTEAQILLQWIHQQGIPSNPRSMNETHMRENLDIFSNPFTISDNDMIRIADLAQDTCEVDPVWYECVGDGNLP